MCNVHFTIRQRYRRSLQGVLWSVVSAAAIASAIVRALGTSATCVGRDLCVCVSAMCVVCSIGILQII